MIARDLNSIELGFDVVIVGAGAAGCSLATNLSQSLRILVVDSKEFPRKKACSGIIVTEGQEYFSKSIDAGVLSETKPLDIEYQDWGNNLKKFSKKGFWNSDRFALDMHLFEPIRQRKNITFLQKTSFVDFTNTSNGLKVVVLESNGSVKTIIAKYIVGCDGALSRIRKIISARKIRFYIGTQEFIKAQKSVDKAYFIFDDDITDFYAWIIPKGNLVELGALVEPKRSKEAYALFKDKVKLKFGIAGDGVSYSAVVLRPESIDDICLGKENVLLCGEAAGLISPSSAEGISYALRSGKYCAEAINSNKNPLKDYYKNSRDMLDRLKEKFKKSKMISSKTLRKHMFD